MGKKKSASVLVLKAFCHWTKWEVEPAFRSVISIAGQQQASMKEGEMLMSAEMSDCTGKVCTPSALKSLSLSTTMGISAPLKDCFEELYLNKDIQYVLQITCYKYIFPKPLVCSPDEINLFSLCMYFQSCTSGVFRHTESWAHKSAGRPGRAQQGCTLLLSTGTRSFSA